MRTALCRTLHTSVAAHKQELLWGQRAGTIRGRQQLGVGCSLGAVVRAGDQAAGDAVGGQINPDPAAAQDLGDPDWVQAYEKAKEDPGAHPYTYPRASADGPMGVKDPAPGAPLASKVAGAARIAAESVGDALRNAANEVAGGVSRGDRQKRPANTDVPSDYASIHVKGRTVRAPDDMDK